MNTADIKKFTTDELSTEMIDEMIRSNKSFEIVAIKDMSYIVNKLEGAIEKQSLKCRVYTGYRGAFTGTAGVGSIAVAGIIGTEAVIGAALLAAPAAVAAGVGIAAHRLATYDPDYEIEKNIFAKSVKVMYKRDVVKEEKEA